MTCQIEKAYPLACDACVAMGVDADKAIEGADQFPFLCIAGREAMCPVLKKATF